MFKVYLCGPLYLHGSISPAWGPFASVLPFYIYIGLYATHPREPPPPVGDSVMVYTGSGADQRLYQI